MNTTHNLYTCQEVGKCSYDTRGKCIYCGKTKNESLEYSMLVPEDILQMSMKIEDWFHKNNIKKWRMPNMISRNHIHELDQYKEKLENIETLINEKIYE